MRERTLHGELSIADDADNEAEFERVQELLAEFNGSAPRAWGDRDAWLGGGVIVCPGVTIGQDTVVGAGAVVTKIFLVRGFVRYRDEDSFRLTAAWIRAVKAFSSISSSSWTSIARRVLPPRLELNSPEGSSSEAPLKNVSLTTL
jgi:hypothetical protein